MQCNVRSCSRSAVIRSRIPCVLVLARRTVKGKESGTRSTEDKPKPPKATSGQSSASKQSRNGNKPSKTTGTGRGRVEDFMRNTPILNRFADGTLILGDLVMIAATEVSSERIPYESMPTLTAVSLGCWVVAAAALGDYKGDPPTTDNWYLGLLGPSFLAIIDSTVTWAVSCVISLAVFSALVQGPQPLLDSGPMLDDLGTDNLSPQLEVAVAALITMACWRGIAARLRHG